MTLRIPTSWAKIAASSVMSEQARPPAPPPPSPIPAEPPRKRRRRKAKQESFVVPLEARNPHLFENCDWIIDGPYRRVPPYFYVPSETVDVLTIRRTTRGLKNVGIIFQYSKSSVPNFATGNQNTIALQSQRDQSLSTAKSFQRTTSSKTGTVFPTQSIVMNLPFPHDPSKSFTMTRTLVS